MFSKRDNQPAGTGTVDRRRFLGTVAAGAATLMLTRGATVLAQSGSSVPTAKAVQPQTEPVNDLFVLPPLPYEYNALEPAIDTQTMQIHHGRHHNAYVTNLNAAVKDYPDLRKRDATDLIAHLDDLPEAIRTAVRNNGGGHVNHAIFWAIMSPKGGGEPVGQLRSAINTTFGDFNTFKAQLNEAATRRFGSGWAWLVQDRQGKLLITSTANQDSPYMTGQVPLLGVDVWEHAYYLKYQNRRADYLNAWWSVVNWDAVARRYEAARG